MASDNLNMASDNLNMASDNLNMASDNLKTPLPQSPPEENTVFTSRVDRIVAWSRRNSLWPMTYGTACCGIELMSVLGPRYDLARFGAEVVRFSPRQSDLMIVAGTITEKMAPVIRRVYEQMIEPKYVIAMGACASSGGFYRAYHVLQGVDKVIPVDVYVPGCPPTPEAVIDGVMVVQKMITDQAPRPWKKKWKPGELR